MVRGSYTPKSFFYDTHLAKAKQKPWYVNLLILWKLNTPYRLKISALGLYNYITSGNNVWRQSTDCYTISKLTNVSITNDRFYWSLTFIIYLWFCDTIIFFSVNEVLHVPFAQIDDVHQHDSFHRFCSNTVNSTLM